MGTPTNQKAIAAIKTEEEDEKTEEKETTGVETMTVLTRAKPTRPAAQQRSLDQETVTSQAKIDEFFGQKKQYATTNLEQLEEAEKHKEKNVTPQDYSEPGPSGYKKEQKKASKSKSFTCNVCLRAFSNSAKLEKHSYSHSSAESSSFKCEHCKKTFSTKFKLVRHVLIHSDQKQFSCVVCDRTFHRKDHLKNHVKVHSPCKTLYICRKPDCKKEYTSNLSYRKHIAMHAAEEGSLMCQMCSKTFETKEDILFHLKVHAGSRSVKGPNEKKFTCDSCDRRFFTRKDVRRHMVVHTGMRDFLCQFCPQRFGRKDHLVRHIKKSHSRMQVKTETDVKSIPESTSVGPVELEKVEISDTSFYKPELGMENEPFKTSPIFFEGPVVKLEDEKPISDLSHSNIEPQTFEVTTSYLENLLTGSFASLNPENELKDLGSQVLKDIGDPTIVELDPVASTSLENVQNVTDDNYLELIDENNESLPLPGFVQTFQNPPQG